MPQRRHLANKIAGFANAANLALGKFGISPITIPGLKAAQGAGVWADQSAFDMGRSLDRWAADRGQKADGKPFQQAPVIMHNTFNIKGSPVDKPEDHARKLSYELGKILPGLTQGDGVMQSRFQSTG